MYKKIVELEKIVLTMRNIVDAHSTTLTHLQEAIQQRDKVIETLNNRIYLLGRQQKFYVEHVKEEPCDS